MREIGFRLRETRENLGYRPEEFAEILKISEGNYRKYEAGKVRFAIDKLAILERTTGADPAYIISGKKSEPEKVSMILANCNREQRKVILECIINQVKELI